MRIVHKLPVLLGLSVLAGCGGSGGGDMGAGFSATKSLHYTLTDLGALPSASNTASKSAFPLPRLSAGTAQTRAAFSPNGLLPRSRAITVADLGSALNDLHGASINNAGQVVITAGDVFDQQPTQAQAVLYQAGNRTTLPTLGGSLSYGFGVNASGQAAGASTLPGDSGLHACLYGQGKATDLGTLGGPSSVAYALNNTGQIVGISDTQATGTNPPAGADSSSTSHMFLYQNGKMSDLGIMEGFLTTPYAINDSGQIAGRANAVTAPTLIAFTTNQGVITPLPSLGGTFSGAYGINNNGLIVGASATAPLDTPTYQQHAVMWQNGKLTDLGTLPNGNHAIALGVNTQGDIVGGSTADGNGAYDLGFVRPRNGVMQNLNGLIATNSGWVLYAASAINDQGQIVGTGRINNALHIYLLTPDNAAQGK